MNTVFVTGGFGFIGSNFIFSYLAKFPDHRIVNIDCRSYASNPHSALEHNENINIADLERLRAAYMKFRPTMTFHFAAETHVDNSITQDDVFIKSNIIGTRNVLACIREFGGRLIHISTDEVFGSLGHDDPPFNEKTPYAPRNPYSASKAASDHLVRAYVNTYGLEAVVTNCSNNYGPRQHSEKFIPTVIRNASLNKPIPIYGTGLNVRDWLYVEDHCDAIMKVAENFSAGDRYCIGGGFEATNLVVASKILLIMGKPESLIEFVKDRKGHDFRYAMDYSLIRKRLNWEPKTPFINGLEKTLRWYNA